jgi:hypothetical protein
MFRSLNSQKQVLEAKKITLQDFKEATLLEVDGDFNPSQLPSTFKWNPLCDNQYEQLK